MTIPFEPVLFGIKINIHLILEYLAFFIAYRYYVVLKRKDVDHINKSNRFSIIIGAAIGAFLGSRLIAFFENPVFDLSQENVYYLLNSKTIMGGLFGGLIGVELTKKIIGEKQSSGDLFTLPIILGIFIGRVGCFLSGTNEFTYGAETDFFMGMNLGDGLMRHPVALYELIFLLLLFILYRYLLCPYDKLQKGDAFKIFMISYFAFRFCVEFIKPNTFFVLGLSSIQWLCILCWLYYIRFFRKLFIHAY